MTIIVNGHFLNIFTEIAKILETVKIRPTILLKFFIYYFLLNPEIKRKMVLTV